MTDEGAPPPRLIPYVVVEREGVQLPYTEDCANEDGWAWVREGEVLSLCGVECSAFEQGAAITISYTCPGGP